MSGEGTVMGERCGWCGSDPLYVDYHDTEWGVPEWDPRALFEKLCLDGFQAGLAWITILRKREAFRVGFAGFEPAVIAEWGEPEVAGLVADAGIVRHRGKIEATIGNARAWLRIEEEHPGGFTDFIWSAVDGRAVQNRFTELGQVPATDSRTDGLSKQLKTAGFAFCGPTIVYAFAQAVGMFNDHLLTCPAHDLCATRG
jgi:DNA-3-methyladenine glycosylase I